MRRKWLTKGEKINHGHPRWQEAKQLWKTHRVSNCSTKYPNDIKKLVLDHFWKRQLSLSEIVPQNRLFLLRKPWKTNKAVRFVTLKAAFLVLILLHLLSFLFFCLFCFCMDNVSSSGILTSEEKRVATARSMMSRERGKRAARRCQQACRIFGTARQLWLHTALIILIQLPQRTVYLRSCFSWSYAAVTKVQKRSACMF